jgi:hypothetical protein
MIVRNGTAIFQNIVIALLAASHRTPRTLITVNSNINVAATPSPVGVSAPVMLTSLLGPAKPARSSQV